MHYSHTPMHYTLILPPTNQPRSFQAELRGHHEAIHQEMASVREEQNRLNERLTMLTSKAAISAARIDDFDKANSGLLDEATMCNPLYSVTATNEVVKEGALLSIMN